MGVRLAYIAAVPLPLADEMQPSLKTCLTPPAQACRARRGLLAAVLACALSAGAVQAHGDVAGPSLPPPVEWQIAQPPGQPPAGVSDLKFAEFFRLPVGPRGLEPSARLLALNGQPVRLVGYMARESAPTAGRLILTPLPVTLGDEDEPLADDLPPSVAYVHFSGQAAAAPLPHLGGLLRLQGRLSVGPRTEADGHVSMVRLLLDEPASKPLSQLAKTAP
jgi:hypothetical protein